MTETITNAVEPVRAQDPARWTPGEYLRKLREEKGHTHAAVGTALHLTVHYIKALESDDYGKLPGLTFVKGYLRSYARFLGADVDKVLALFDEHIVGLLDAGMHTARVERSKRRQDQALRWGVGAGFVVVAGLAAGWWFMSGQSEPEVNAAASSPPSQQNTVVAASPPARTTMVAARINPPAAAVVSQPPASTLDSTTAMPGQLPSDESLQGPAALAGDVSTAAPNAATLPADASRVPGGEQDALATTPEAASLPATNSTTAVTPAANGARQVSLVSAGDDELSVSFIGNSWIEVDDGSLERIFQDMLAAGDTLTIHGEAPFHVLLGDARNVELRLNAEAVDFSADIRADSTARLVLGAPVGAQDGQQVAPEAPL